MAGTPVPPWLDNVIRTRVSDFANCVLLRNVVRASGASLGPPLCIKYMSPKWGLEYRTGRASAFVVSEHASFTWGRATYVTPLAFLMSTATFGRIGVVAEFDPTHWRIFDATDDTNRDLYLEWARRQREAKEAYLTVRAMESHHAMRNNFRIQYGIDCVLFRPDEHNHDYTNPHTDVWMAVTDWTDSSRTAIGNGKSRWFKNPRVCLHIEEEFQTTGRGRMPLLNRRRSSRSTFPTPDDCAKVYHSSGNPISVPA